MKFKACSVFPASLLLLLVGCDEFRSKALIADYVVGGQFEILNIDGVPVERIQHGAVVTRVPYVMVDEGTSAVELRRRPLGGVDDGRSFFVTAEFQKGKIYEIVETDGHIQVIEKTK